MGSHLVMSNLTLTFMSRSYTVPSHFIIIIIILFTYIAQNYIKFLCALHIQ